jgi:methionyl-tRNA synthetase
MKVLIGLSWVYANGRLHIGHVGSSLPADVIARYHRSIGNDVSFVTGSDCFGTPILVSALSEGLTPTELAQKYHELLDKDFKSLNFSFDNYDKTMSERHKKFVTKFHKEMYAREFIYEKTAPQLYCESCNKFLPDRYVEGVCPHCKKGAKGDSCDGCGKILEPEELIDPRCKLCKGGTVPKDATQLYLKLSAMQDIIQEHFNKVKDKWTATAQGLTARYLKEGLHDRAITRNIEWGIAIPKGETWADRAIYVWAENVLGYLSASENEFILNKNKDLLHYYVHAKDNVPFHSIILPGLIIAQGGEYHLPDVIVASEYVNLEGQKMSKSKGNVLMAEELVSFFDVDMIRYYFLRSAAIGKDMNFTFQDFVNIINGELVNNWGNLVNRCLSFCRSKFGHTPPSSRAPLSKKGEPVRVSVGKLIEEGKVNKALSLIMDEVGRANKYFDERKPWVLIKTDEEACEQVMGEMLGWIEYIVGMLEPFIPSACARVRGMLSGGDVEVLFKRLDLNEVKERFSKYV